MVVDAIRVHPLLFVGGFIAHTALAVLFAVHVAPLLVASVGLSVTTAAIYWLVFATLTLALGVVRQMEDK